jgi:hypothetical protein
MPSDGFVTRCNNWLRSSRLFIKTGTGGAEGSTARHVGKMVFDLKTDGSH